GTYRWVVERTFAGLHGFRRLHIHWERRAGIHAAFLRLACCLITHRQTTHCVRRCKGPNELPP
ncbi:transposase, partial [Streptomyces griseocarneus]|uniref:transposase n=1 Tax=Streptomyces griseocarneus TaxID=51201 RepID=UPI00167D021B